MPLELFLLDDELERVLAETMDAVGPELASLPEPTLAFFREGASLDLGETLDPTRASGAVWIDWRGKLYAALGGHIESALAAYKRAGQDAAELTELPAREILLRFMADAAVAPMIVADRSRPMRITVHLTRWPSSGQVEAVRAQVKRYPTAGLSWDAVDLETGERVEEGRGSQSFEAFATERGLEPGSKVFHLPGAHDQRAHGRRGPGAPYYVWRGEIRGGQQEDRDRLHHHLSRYMPDLPEGMTVEIYDGHSNFPGHYSAESNHLVVARWALRQDGERRFIWHVERDLDELFRRVIEARREHKSFHLPGQHDQRTHGRRGARAALPAGLDQGWGPELSREEAERERSMWLMPDGSFRALTGWMRNHPAEAHRILQANNRPLVPGADAVHEVQRLSGAVRLQVHERDVGIDFIWGKLTGDQLWAADTLRYPIAIQGRLRDLFYDVRDPATGRVIRHGRVRPADDLSGELGSYMASEEAQGDA